MLVLVEAQDLPAHGQQASWWTLLVGVLVASAGLGLFYGALTPRSFGADEPAHTAYAEVVADASLPDVGTIQPASAARIARGGQPHPSDYIYVANHPPLFAAVQGLLARGLRELGVGSSTLAAGRFLNAACVLSAVAAAAMLGREVTGSLRLGVLGAGLFAATPALWSLSTYGYSDGLAVLATVLVAWSGVIAWRQATTGTIAWLAAAIALSGAARATALLMAVPVGLAVALRVAVRLLAKRDGIAGRRAKLAPLATHTIGVAAMTCGPAALLVGWWYVRTWIRFGDPTASAVLNGRLGRRSPPGGVIGRLLDIEMWRSMITELLASCYTANFEAEQPRLATWAVATEGLVAAAAVGGLALAAFRGRTVVAGWPILAVIVAGNLFGIAGHTAGGGSAHPRYLLLVIPILAVVVVAGLDPLHRHLPAVAVVGLTLASVVMVAKASTWIDDAVSGPIQRFGPAWLRLVGVAIAGLGLLVIPGAKLVSDRRLRSLP